MDYIDTIPDIMPVIFSSLKSKTLISVSVSINNKSTDTGEEGKVVCVCVCVKTFGTRYGIMLQELFINNLTTTLQ